MDYQYQTPAGEVKTIHLTRQHDGTFLATIDGRSYTVGLHRRTGAMMVLNINDSLNVAHTARNGNTHYIAMNGQMVQLEKPAPTAERARGSYVGELTASMPGQVTKILIQPGDVVKQGQTLLLMEAMKMEMRVKAPRDGQIKAVLCEAGQAVERGQNLVEFEEEADE